MESNRDSFKLSKDSDNSVQLMFDQPKSGQNSYGNWYLYGCIKDGRETSFFATDNLHKKLSIYGQGAELTIRQEEYAPGKSAWNVTAKEGTQTRPPQTATATNGTIDSRTHDIHKQVCLKLAVQMFGNTISLLSDAEVTIIKANMTQLLYVLENPTTEEVKPLTFKGDKPF
tara:strand:- start:7305 stop:7817 length:513 start_codon:yes stop_codon:yes gene_type:complete